MRYRILLIDDNSTNASILECFAEEKGWEFKWYSCAETFLKMANLSDYDIIFVDWQLPDMNGLELCDIIRIKSNIPLIIHTAYAMTSDKERALMHANDYFAKPPIPMEFYNLVEKYCNNNASL